MKVCPKCGGNYPVDEGFCPMDGARLSTVTKARDHPDDAQEWVGEVLDRRYRLDEVIGVGGMGFVFRATHTLIGKTLAVKMLRPSLVREEEVVRRFLQEARLASSVKHPNVVDISDYGELPGGGAYYVMEYLSGRTLADRIDHVGVFEISDAMAVALQICSGLTAAHGEGIVHRDLKPDNVFLCDRSDDEHEPFAKLLDFGIARAGSRITVAGAVLGTPEYMSPEQARATDVDHRADLYSMGVILFEMLTGLVPFRSDDVASTIYSQIHVPAPTLGEVAPQLSHLRASEALIAQLLAKSPDERTQSATETMQLMCEALELDLGHETAARLTKATLNIASGDLVPRGGTQGPMLSTDQMGWAGSEETQPTEGEITSSEGRKPAPAGLVIVGAATVAAAVTFAGYSLLGEDGPDATQPAETAPAGQHWEVTPAMVEVPVPVPSPSPAAPTASEKQPQVPPAPAAPPGASPAVDPTRVVDRIKRTPPRRKPRAAVNDELPAKPAPVQRPKSNPDPALGAAKSKREGPRGELRNPFHRGK